MCFVSFASLPCLLSNLLTPFCFQTGEWSSPGGVSHQKETGLSTEGVSHWRQGRYRQLQHQSPAPSHSPGPAEEPAAGTAPRQWVEMHMQQSNTCQQMKRRKRAKEGGLN